MGFSVVWELLSEEFQDFWNFPNELVPFTASFTPGHDKYHLWQIQIPAIALRANFVHHIMNNLTREKNAKG